MDIAITRPHAARVRRHDARRRSPVIESWKPTWRARRHDAQRAAHPHARAPSRRTRDDLESHGKAAFRRRMGGCRPAPGGGPPCFIQEEDDAMRSPGLKHAPPARANRCVGLSCLLYSSFSCPPDSKARRARPSPDGSNPRTAHAQPLTLSVRHSNAFSGFPEQHRRLAGRPLHRINRANFLEDFVSTGASHPPHSTTHRLLLYSNVFGE
ncbi:hypothetical protein BLA6993_00395 [Burkholderia lata]|nr:hypothetical protein BLA6993_00395 [Burkholderia lata]